MKTERRVSSRWDRKVSLDPRRSSPYTVRVSELRRQGKEIISLQPGDPALWGFENEAAKEALTWAAEEDWRTYPEVTKWRDTLRESIAKFEREHRGVAVTAEDTILTPGCAAALTVIHYTLLDVGDNIISFDPYHYLTGPSSYWSYFGAKLVTCDCLEDAGWVPDIAQLRKRITPKTKAVFVNSPNNPTGAVYDSKLLKKIIDVAGEFNLLVISDEIYGLITFDGMKAPSLASLSSDVPSIVINGMSKIFACPGWRIGYFYFHDPEDRVRDVREMATRLAAAYGHMTSCIPTPILAAASYLYSAGSQSSIAMVREMQKRRDFTVERFKEIPGIHCQKPLGALYAFPAIEVSHKRWRSGEQFLTRLLEDHHVAFDVGSWYGRLGRWHFRTLLLPSIPVLDEVYSRLERFMTARD